MEKFVKHTGTGVPLRRSNVDTDQIIPAVYLKRVTRSGFEDGLFAAWRNDPEFVLNKEAFKKVPFLLQVPILELGLLASTQCGRCKIMDLKSLFQAVLQTSSGVIPSRVAC